jgi:hypothetical protein
MTVGKCERLMWDKNKEVGTLENLPSSSLDYQKSYMGHETSRIQTESKGF